MEKEKEHEQYGLDAFKNYGNHFCQKFTIGSLEVTKYKITG